MIDRNSKRIGNICRLYRQNVLDMTQKELSFLCGYSKENISAFECGRNDNYRILLLYIGLGLLETISIKELCGKDYKTRGII